MPRPIAKDYDQKRQQILAASAIVFAEHGFDRSSMTQLATACGISKANIYHYFPSKDALLFGILDTYLRGLRDRICGLDVTTLPPKGKLRAVILETLLAYDGADVEHRIQSKGFAMLPDTQQSQLRGYQRDLVKCYSDILLQLAPEPFQANRILLRNATMSVFGMLNWYFMWNTESSAQARQQYAETVSAMAIGGVNGF